MSRLWCWVYREVLHRFGWCHPLCNYCYAEAMDAEAEGRGPVVTIEVVQERPLRREEGALDVHD